MTVRGADYNRRKLDDYPTPSEVTQALLMLWRCGKHVWEPAAGKRLMIANVLKSYGYQVCATDITNRNNSVDFLMTGENYDHMNGVPFNIVTNPPYGDRRGSLALRFIEHALKITREYDGQIAMLLPVDFDSGKTRDHVFGQCKAFSGKIVLLDRIRWFNNQAGSTNHAWYLWSWSHHGPPTIRYAKLY